MNGFERFFSLPPDRIGYTKHILEGYDNLAVLSTVSAQEGIVRVWGSDQKNYEDVVQIMTELGAQPLAAPVYQSAKA
ncbi:MAG: hypothetical protein CSA34_02255 [Desulfobulbus propionicus]|nr:MAG: hypothetical protein CSA34_02255 [Desulfobulbus propionicus]